MGDLTLACCGLDCAACDIYRAGDDPALAARLADAFVKMGYADARPDWFHCQGCRGPQNAHWDATCFILQCCQERGLDHCAQCEQFACERLEEWGRGMAHHREALDRLRGLV
jgi:hypothetical protein